VRARRSRASRRGPGSGISASGASGRCARRDRPSASRRAVAARHGRQVRPDRGPSASPPRGPRPTATPIVSMTRRCGGRPRHGLGTDLRVGEDRVRVIAEEPARQPERDIDRHRQPGQGFQHRRSSAGRSCPWSRSPPACSSTPASGTVICRSDTRNATDAAPPASFARACSRSVRRLVHLRPRNTNQEAD
jgi:hypothetical protein